ncbi:DinB family protein [Chitinophaga rhizosphaerae]|uniref:DinB family protein n=1 Tax=Chitinophaga rhizosphaerae TaxID=1864947 RepID=UPI000F80A8E2|nr:DinB family protein [Chitinophaga rhizosphaerae]
MPRPMKPEYAVFYETYVSRVPEDDLTAAFRKHTASLLVFLNKIPAAKREYAYAPGKWTVKEVLQHIIDAERVFAYRALNFARKDANPLPGFDENAFAAVARTEHREWNDMVEEFQFVRNASDHFFRALNEEELSRTGVASGNPVSVRALGFIILGHAIHHMEVVKERYL